MKKKNSDTDNQHKGQYDILIVDDVPGNLTLLSEILTRSNYNVRLAADAATALESIKTKPPFILLLDVELPDMDGYELCKLLKEDDSTKGIPVIFLTVHNSPKDKIRCFDAGGADFISKPFIIEEVLARVNIHVTFRKFQTDLEKSNITLKKEIEDHKLAAEKLVHNIELANALLETEKRNRKAMLSILHDQKDILDLLKVSEKNFRDLVENALIGIYTTSLKGKILFANNAMCELLESDSIDELINADAEMFYKDKAEREKFVEKINESKQIFDYEIEMITKNNKVKNVLVNAFISGEAITGMMLDITERKQAEKEIINAKEEAEKLSRLKSNFLSNMSHEIRTPLTGILGFSEIIRNEYDLEEVKNMVAIINKSGKRLLNTLNQILDLSSLDAHTKELNYKLTDVTEIIKETISLYSAAAKKKNLELTYASEIFPLMAYTEPDIMSSTFNNIVSNAIIYTMRGGITVKTCEEIIDGKECIVVNVIDTGIGIEEKNLELIFDEFRQVSEGLGRQFEGTGLGLSLCRKYMNLLGGSVSVTSKAGEGSDFRLVIPKNNLKCEKPSESKKNIPVKTFRKDSAQIKSDIKKKPKILYIEDEIYCIVLVKCILINKYDVETAGNGAEGIEKTKNNEYALILLDVNLGKGITGLEALSEIRKNPYYKDIPVIALTAFAQTGDEEEFRAAGCTDYISKPFEKEKLLEKISRAL